MSVCVPRVETKVQRQSKWRSETKIDNKNIFVCDSFHHHATMVPKTRASYAERKVSLFLS